MYTDFVECDGGSNIVFLLILCCFLFIFHSIHYSFSLYPTVLLLSFLFFSFPFFYSLLFSHLLYSWLFSSLFCLLSYLLIYPFLFLYFPFPYFSSLLCYPFHNILQTTFLFSHLSRGAFKIMTRVRCR